MSETADAVYTPEHAPVLVAVMNNRSDFERARDEGWYRIPLKRAPRRIAAEYLAFYQTGAFGDEGCAVNYFAPVRRFQVLSRGELLPDQPDHPRAAEIDTLVLACTHFPLLRDELATLFGPQVALVDGAQGIARRIATLTEGQPFARAEGDLAVTTGPLEEFRALAPRLHALGLERIAKF